MPKKKIERPIEKLDEVQELVEVPKVEGLITLKARHEQLGGECIRTFTNREDANAWKKRFNAIEL